MRIGVTGAGGFVGKALVDRLSGECGDEDTIVAIDAYLSDPLPPNVQRAMGDICDPGFIADLFCRPFDVFFHLAAVPGGIAESNYDLGWQVNAKASSSVFERLAAQERPARLVFASSIAVFGTPSSQAMIDDDTLPIPTLSYGAQKLMMETLVCDLARRGRVDGVSVRLSGVLARPPEKLGHLSAYMSDILHALRAGSRFVCPVGDGATSWFVSRATCVDNLIHASNLSRDSLKARRSFTLPALRLSMRELVEGAEVHFGPGAAQLVSYRPQPFLQEQFGSYPPLATRIADELGFRHDGNAATLVAKALELPSIRPASAKA